ncbi:hypothetical protein JTM40_33885, partial [Pseudomonas aeruginosa]|nr:hypothetical protein [Pseudomonas aeruginosa]
MLFANHSASGSVGSESVVITLNTLDHLVVLAAVVSNKHNLSAIRIAERVAGNQHLVTDLQVLDNGHV